jgi:hypothetical protein
LKTRFRILIPVRLYKENSRAFVARQRKVLLEFINIDLPVSLGDYGNIPVGMRHIKSSDKLPAYGRKLLQKYISQDMAYDYIEIFVDIKLNEPFMVKYLTESFVKQLESTPFKWLRKYCIEWMCIEFIFGVKNALLAANIACPGYITTSEGIICVNGALQKTIDPGYQFFNSIVEETIERGWPPIENIPISKTWEWCCKVPGFTTGEGKSACGRALAALSHIFREISVYDPGLDIIWALIGLEALYCKSTTGLQIQLHDKSEAFLGEMYKYKKDFSGMYDFRSRLIHGDVDINFMHLHLENKGKYIRRLEDSSLVAIALLVSTLQRMVKLDIFQLEFAYILKNVGAV